jgi:hypothetical protein
LVQICNRDVKNKYISIKIHPYFCYLSLLLCCPFEATDGTVPFYCSQQPTPGPKVIVRKRLVRSRTQTPGLHCGSPSALALNFYTKNFTSSHRLYSGRSVHPRMFSMFKRGPFPTGGVKLGGVGVAGSGVGVAGGIHPQTYMRISPGIDCRLS